MTLAPISPLELKKRLDEGDAVLIDIRESDEHAREHIVGARLAPLSAIDAHDFDREHAKLAVFHCKSGMRTQANAALLLAKGFRDARCLEGGIDAWKAAGLPIHSNAKAPLEIMRQVQITAGALVVLGVALGLSIHPGFFVLCAFIGSGLFFAGITGWCGMATLLKRMPWNKPRTA